MFLDFNYYVCSDCQELWFNTKHATPCSPLFSSTFPPFFLQSFPSVSLLLPLPLPSPLSLPTDKAVQQHLDLLREQYVKLQQRHAELEQRYTQAIATSGNVGPDHFVSRLLKVVADLFDKPLYRWGNFLGGLYILGMSLWATPSQCGHTYTQSKLYFFTASSFCYSLDYI